jgi:hypothetical protein
MILCYWTCLLRPKERYQKRGDYTKDDSRKRLLLRVGLLNRLTLFTAETPKAAENL